jgi:hypothetical protein
MASAEKEFVSADLAGMEITAKHVRIFIKKQ